MDKLLSMAIISLILFSCTQKKADTRMLMYIGTSNNNIEKGIELCYFDTVSGELSKAELATPILNPNYQCIDVSNNVLYSVGKLPLDSNTWATPVVVSYAIDANTGSLKGLSADSTYGSDPCYVAYNDLNKSMYVANYGSGNVSAYVIEKGEIKYKNTIQHFGNGPNENRQKGPHAHSINYSSPEGYIYAADLGADKLMVYKGINEGLQLIDSVVCHPGAGPRHFDFSPDGQLMAVLNELDCTVSLFEKDSAGIFKTALNTLTMLPDTFKSFSKAADIHFSPDGKFLYASNRGFHSIAIYKISDKQMEFVAWETEGINWPRNFTIDPSGNFLLVANKFSDNITVYQRDIITGLLKKLPYETQVEKPVCLTFYR
ncbi:lactonase family protein [Labilibacter sediminis]|nr:lactonase family protein [Labilibacter sediminis]